MEIEYRSWDGSRLSAVRRGVIDINDQIVLVGDKVGLLDERLSPIPSKMGDVQNSLNSYRGQLDSLEHRNAVHSARLKLLREELDHVKLENDVLLDHLKTQDVTSVHQQKLDHDTHKLEPNKGTYLRERRGQLGEIGTQDEPYLEKRPTTHDDNNRPTSGDEKRPEIKNYKLLRGESRSSDTSSVDEIYKKEKMDRLRRREIYGCHDSTAINPQFWEPLPSKGAKIPFDHKKYPHPGGFLFMRFDDSGCEIAKDAIKRMQSICRNAGGYLLGTARKQRIFVFEVAPSRQMNWFQSRWQPYKELMMTENAVAVFWFIRREAASEFMDSSHNNRFREPCFPTPSGYEAFYVPLLITPPIKPYNCFLFIEFVDACRYATEDMVSFEAEVRHDMLDWFPDCLPMVVSALEGKEIFKPGVFVSPYSKLYICRFTTQADVDEIWKMGMIQGLRHKWNLTGPINVFSFVIDS